MPARTACSMVEMLLQELIDEGVQAPWANQACIWACRRAPWPSDRMGSAANSAGLAGPRPASKDGAPIQPSGMAPMGWQRMSDASIGPPSTAMSISPRDSRRSRLAFRSTWNSMPMPGWRCLRALNSATSERQAITSPSPILSTLCAIAGLPAARRSCAASVITRVACASNSRPLRVSCTWRPMRSNSTTSSSLSSSRIRAETAACEVHSRSAAALKVPSWLIQWKVSSCVMFMAWPSGGGLRGRSAHAAASPASASAIWRRAPRSSLPVGVSGSALHSSMRSGAL